MLIRIRNLRKSQDGQAIILAALGALILAIGVLATVNLGHAIHERIKLQNVADATAYSLAALEARSFNFFAFTNRAQVSQYVTAMSLQSWLAVFWFIDMALGLLADVTNMICSFTCSLCENLVLPACPIAGAVCGIYGGLRTAYKVWHKITKQVDKIIGKVVYYIGKFNKYGTFLAQKLMKEMIRINLGSAALLVPEITKENDPEAKWWPMGGVASAVLNVVEYSNAFDTKAEKLSKSNISDSSTYPARRVMTEVSNATRYPPFVSNRNLGDFMSKLPGIGPFLGVIWKFLPFKFEVTGQTKLISMKDKCGWSSNCRCDQKRFSTKKDHSQLARGNTLVADQVVLLSISIFRFKRSFGNEDYVSIWADHKSGEHCAYDHIGPSPFYMPSCPWTYFPFPQCAGDKKNHNWDGIQPYIKFNPKSDDEFQRQPSTYVFLNKKPEDLGGQAYVQKFNFTVGSRTESLDTNIGVDPLISFFGQVKGLNAWSRGMAYYHRPSFKSGESNWHEHPNFFNPFWRAKLAPLGEKLDQFVGKLGIPGNAAKIFSRELITH